MSVFKDARIYPMLGAMLALLLAALDQTIVATALPEIVREFNGLEHLSWVVTAYLLASTVATPIIGKLSDIYGRKLFFLFGILVFLLGSILSGISWSMMSLIFFRAIQGIGAGATLVNCFAVIGDLFAPIERGRWQGFVGATFGLASIAGPLLGGWLTDYLSWRFIFYINIPIGFVALLVIWITLPHRKKRLKKQPIDFFGAALLVGFIIPFLLALVWAGTLASWLSPTIFALLFFSILCLLMFLVVEQRAIDPILPLWLFKHRAFNIPVIVMFLVMIGLFGSVLFIPLFAQSVIGLSATHAGLVLTPMVLSLVFSSVVGGQIITRTHKYKALIVSGVGLVALSMYLFSRFSINTGNLELTLKMVLMGLGLGVTMPILNLVIQNAFGQHYLGVVSSSLQVARSIGGAFGSALLGGFLNKGLITHLAKLPDEPFLKYLPHHQENGLNAIENFLTPQGYASLKEIIANLPKSERPSEYALDHYISIMRTAFSDALSNTYFIATFILILAFLFVIFLPVIPLRKQIKTDDLNLI